MLAGGFAQVLHCRKTGASPGGYLHRTGSLGIRSGRHANAPGSSSSVSCYCNGSVGLNQHTNIYTLHPEGWELKKVFFHPSAGGLEIVVIIA